MTDSLDAPLGTILAGRPIPFRNMDGSEAIRDPILRSKRVADPKSEALPHGHYGAFCKLIKTLGFSHFIVGLLPVSTASEFADLVLLTNLPSLALSEIESLSAFAIWNPVIRLRQTVAPYAFGHSGCGHSALAMIGGNVQESFVSEEFSESFVALSVESGCCVPLVTLEGRRAYALLMAEGSFPTAELAEIALEVARLFDQMCMSKDWRRQRCDEQLLTARELECMQWVAAGKTSSEIAQITELSEHTVNHYLTICCRKLDAVNRVQATVKAVRSGLI